MKKSMLAMAVAVAMQSAVAQNVSFEAYKIADIFAASSGHGVITMMVLIAQKLETEFVSKGVAAEAARRFGHELKEMGNADYAKAYAVQVAEHYTAAEQRTLLNFLESEVGRKYVASLSPDSPLSQAAGQALFREACKRAKLTSRDIQGIC